MVAERRRPPFLVSPNWRWHFAGTMRAATISLLLGQIRTDRPRRCMSAAIHIMQMNSHQVIVANIAGRMGREEEGGDGRCWKSRNLFSGTNNLFKTAARRRQSFKLQGGGVGDVRRRARGTLQAPLNARVKTDTDQPVQMLGSAADVTGLSREDTSH